MSGILTKLSARGSPRGRPEGKKALTVRQKCGNLRNYYRYRADRWSREFLKKFLTNGMKFCIIAMFRRERRAPCKLNNVTKRKHQKVISLR